VILLFRLVNLRSKKKKNDMKTHTSLPYGSA
jgi:hypothetical protein